MKAEVQSKPGGFSHGGPIGALRMTDGGGDRLECDRPPSIFSFCLEGLNRAFSILAVRVRDSVIYNNCFMTAYVYVSLKKSVLDPQGKTIQGALKKMGYKGLESVRQGKYFELTLDHGLSREEAQTEVERIAREVLTNPVIEEFRFSFSQAE